MMSLSGDRGQRREESHRLPLTTETSEGHPEGAALCGRAASPCIYQGRTHAGSALMADRFTHRSTSCVNAFTVNCFPESWLSSTIQINAVKSTASGEARCLFLTFGLNKNRDSLDW